MDGLLLPLLTAAAVVLLVMGGIRIGTILVKGEKRKLQNRLTADDRPSGLDDIHRSITVQLESTGLPPSLAKHPIVRALHKRVVQAWPEVTLVRFLAVAAAIGLGLGLLSFPFFGSGLMVVGVMAFGFYLPFFVLTLKRNKRQKLLADQLPEALDFLSRILRAGHSLSTGLQMMGQELPQPLAAEFRKCYDQHSLGTPLETALKDMAARVESTDFAFFITAILIQRQTGGDLSEVLNNISSMIRQRIRLQQHVKAKTAEGRFTGYILVAFPAVMFFIVCTMNPDYSNTLLRTSTGLWLLGTAFGLQMLGLFAIRKITTVRV